jgi:hypothetical protein
VRPHHAGWNLETTHKIDLVRDSVVDLAAVRYATVNRNWSEFNPVNQRGWMRDGRVEKTAVRHAFETVKKPTHHIQAFIGREPLALS